MYTIPELVYRPDFKKYPTAILWVVDSDARAFFYTPQLIVDQYGFVTADYDRVLDENYNDDLFNGEVVVIYR